jgi:hypothetical protein
LSSAQLVPQPANLRASNTSDVAASVKVFPWMFYAGVAIRYVQPLVLRIISSEWSARVAHGV